jgi:hypothetical protein
VIPAAAVTEEEAAVGNDSLSPTRIGLISFGTTFAIVIALFAAGMLPLWLAAVILLLDGFFTYWLTARLERAG